MSSEEPLDLQRRLALRPREAAAALGISERTLRELAPQLPSIREGGVRLYPVESLRTWLRERAGVEGDQVDKVTSEILADLNE